MARPKKGQEHPRPRVAEEIGQMAAIGIPHNHMARILGISTETMHKYYKDDLDLGADKAGVVVGGKIFEAAKKGEPWACTLWAVRRMGWKETNVQQQTGPDGGPIQTEATIKADDTITNLLEELARLKAGSAKQG